MLGARKTNGYRLYRSWDGKRQSNNTLMTLQNKTLLWLADVLQKHRQ